MPQNSVDLRPETARQPARAGDVTVLNREKIIITGVTGVVSFDGENVCVETTGGTLSVDGSGLSFSRLDLDRGEAEVDGRFIGMFFTEPRKKGGKRFFGRG